MPAGKYEPSGPAVVREVTPDGGEWDRLALEHEDSGIYHLSPWAGILESAYGYKPRYLALREGGRLAGILPVMQSYGLVSGKRLRSLPLVGSVGALAGSPGGEHLLVEAACRMTEEAGARSLAVHATKPGYDDAVAGLRLTNSFDTYVAPLPGDADELRRGWKKTRNNLWRSLKKADAAGMTVRRADSAEDMAAFHRLYRDTMRRHRSLPQSLRFFQLVRTQLPPEAHMLIVAEHEGEMLAGAVFYMHRDIVYLIYNASAPHHLEMRPNHAVYWEAIRWSIENGRRRFAMGQAPEGSSLARFKQQWGGEPVPRYVYEFVPGAAAAGASASKSLRAASNALDADEGESLAAKAWDRAPLPLTSAAAELAYRFF